MRLYRRTDPSTKRPTGPWRVKVYDLTGARHDLTTHQHDYRAALQVARELERTYTTPGARSRGTLGDALDLLLKDRATRRAAATVQFYKERAERLRRGLRGETPLAQLTAPTLDAFVSKRRAQVSASTVHKELTTLRAALKLAKRAGLWSGDLEQLVPVVSVAYEPRTRWLTRGELERLCDALAPDRGAFVAFVVATGARLGEARRARREDVSAQGDAVRLRGTKTRASERVVPIVGRDGKACLAYALANAQGTGGALFTEWRGIHQALIRACARAGITRCSPNDLRRSYAQWLRQAGASPGTIAPTMGHRDSTMVERVYGRLGAKELGERLRAELGAE